MITNMVCQLQRMKEKVKLSQDARFFSLFLFVRLLSILLVQTWYVPDEYWQSMEVAHSMVFGYGHRTWEWVLGLRSYLHPLLIAVLYKTLHLLNMDSVTMLVLGPRLCQAVLSAYADLKFYHWSGKQKWAAFNIACSWFWFYTGSRTLINSFENCISTIALSQFPWPGSQSKGGAVSELRWLWLVGLVCVARPTAAVLWVPLCAYHLWGAAAAGQLRRALLGYALVAAVCLVGCVALDSLCHGQLLVTPWEFLRVNVLQEVGSHYGAQPWHWYLSTGLPTVLGVQLVPWVLAAVHALRQRHSQPPHHLVLLAATLWTLAVYSCLPHKEFRFVLPLVPVSLHLSSQLLASWSRKASRLHVWLVAAVLLVSNALPAVYLGTVHQRGTLDVMAPVAQLAAARPNDTSFLFLMPCHSTPLYSHIHVPVPVRFLRCEPKLEDVGYAGDEADDFYENPNRWLHAEYPPDGTLPSHIVTFDTLVPRISSLLSRYRPLKAFAHTRVPLSSRIGYNVVIHQHLEY